jgi:hypothetical protein
VQLDHGVPWVNHLLGFQVTAIRRSGNSSN